ncbi:MAG: hypothetical protein WDM79_06875 [Terricaulis sp.]
MKAKMLCLALLALAACSPAPAPPAPVETAPAAIDLAALEGRIIARGAAPDWRLEADPEIGVILTTHGHEDTTSALFAAPQRFGERGAQLISGDIVLTLDDAPCTLAGASYPYTATVKAGEADDVLSGCAFVRWDAQLMALLPAIDSCLSEVTEETPLRISYAATQSDGRVLVRVRNENGGYDCRVTPGVGDPMPDIGPSDPALLIGGDGAAIFVRAPGENPGGQCYEAPEVRAADGALLGWMDDPEGC